MKEHSKKNAEEPMAHHGGSGSLSHHERHGHGGLDEFKGEADPIAYGQAGEAGCKSDHGKLKSQMKDYHWD